MNNDKKLPPYNRLKMMLRDDNEVTEKASKNLDELLGVLKRPSLFDKLKKFFKKIDSYIFSKSKLTNKYTKRR